MGFSSHTELRSSDRGRSAAFPLPLLFQPSLPFPALFQLILWRTSRATLGILVPFSLAKLPPAEQSAFVLVGQTEQLKVRPGDSLKLFNPVPPSILFLLPSYSSFHPAPSLGNSASRKIKSRILWVNPVVFGSLFFYPEVPGAALPWGFS